MDLPLHPSRVLLLALGLLLMAGCDAGPSDSEALDGTWQGVSADAPAYLYFDDPVYREYAERATCYAARTSEYEVRAGSTLVIISTRGETSFTFSLEADLLILKGADEETWRFEASDVNVDTLPLC